MSYARFGELQAVLRNLTRSGRAHMLHRFCQLSEHRRLVVCEYNIATCLLKVLHAPALRTCSIRQRHSSVSINHTGDTLTRLNSNQVMQQCLTPSERLGVNSVYSVSKWWCMRRSLSGKSLNFCSLRWPRICVSRQYTCLTVTVNVTHFSLPHPVCEESDVDEFSCLLGDWLAAEVRNPAPLRCEELESEELCFVTLSCM